MLALGTVRRGSSSGTSAPPGKGRQGGDRPCAGPVAKVGQPPPNRTIQAKSVERVTLSKSPDPA